MRDAIILGGGILFFATLLYVLSELAERACRSRL
jgi:hypothetical protein